MSRSKQPNNQEEQPKQVLCAIYTRKSTDENLHSDFTSLDSQREYCQSFVQSRGAEGWQVYSERYDDGGFSGGNMDRPALRKLLMDARERKFGVVVCYKFDRLSRNTKDFLHILDIFEKYGVAFVSVTQPIDTSSSIGRLMRSILMDFAQFEREIISERTRDKIAAMVKKGKWIGGRPILGYDVDHETKRLVINAEETKHVEEMFRSYIRLQSLSLAAKHLNKLGLRMKTYTTKTSKKVLGGTKFSKSSLSFLLGNPVYVGQVRYKNERYKGEHEAIIPDDLFKAANDMLESNVNGQLYQAKRRDEKHVFLLQGILRCGSCGYAMTPSFSYSRKIAYYYYKCVPVLKSDKSGCEIRAIPAQEIDDCILHRIKRLAEQPDIIEQIVERAQMMTVRELPEKIGQRRAISGELAKVESDSANLIQILAEEGSVSARKTAIFEQLDKIEAKKVSLKSELERINKEIREMEERRIDAEVVRVNLKNFNQVFAKLEDPQKRELVSLLVKKVVYHGALYKVEMTLRSLPELKWNETPEGFFVLPVQGPCPDPTGNPNSAGPVQDASLSPTGYKTRTPKRRNSANNLSPNGGLNGEVLRPVQESCLSPTGYKTGTGQINDLIEILLHPGIADHSNVDQVNGWKGEKEVLFLEQADLVREGQRRHRPAPEPKAPTIQRLLAKAKIWRAKLEADPSITRAALAKEVGVDPSFLTRVLNLLNLHPLIQDHILTMRPSVHPGPITERRLQSLARSRDPKFQLREFERIKAIPPRVRYPAFKEAAGVS